MPFYAHTHGPDESDWQTLQDHLIETAQKAYELGQDAGVSDYAYLAALLHDIGKYSAAFQRRLRGTRERVDHKTAGVQEVLRLYDKTRVEQATAQLLAFCIAGHHGGLPDYGSPGDDESAATLQARIKRTQFPQDFTYYARDIALPASRLPPAFSIRPLRENAGFSLAFLTRMIFSVLVDADFLDTERVMRDVIPQRGGYPDLPTLRSTYNGFLQQFEAPSGAINFKRTEVLQACLQHAAQPPGFFTLTVPTGGGKTFSSLAFALNHAAAHGMKRIIYVIPYTSIIEQNAAEMKKVLGEANVLEHHANFDWQGGGPDGARDEREETGLAGARLKLSSENWDIPVVVTTNVQFFESLYANRPARCRKVHNMARSVVILDEAQMLPREYLRPCMYALSELVSNYGASAVFCTATQPAAHLFLPGSPAVRELAPDPPALYAFFKRVQVEDAGVLSDDALIARMNELPQVLCVVNTRRHARGIFAGLRGEGCFHLSTYMCPAHRKETIRQVRLRLAAGLPCKVVSTQIMEAGIDVDFPVGFRALAGLDSIVQAAGRVNREGRQPSGVLYVFTPDSPHVRRVPAYIAQGAQIARGILREYQDPICGEAIAAYFDRLYRQHDRAAFDAKGILSRFGSPGNPVDFQFQTAAEDFRLVENDTVAVIIPYDAAARDLIARMAAGDCSWAVTRQAQQVSVNIFAYEFAALQAAGMVGQVQGVYNVLNENGQYHSDTGLVIPQGEGGEAVFFDG